MQTVIAVLGALALIALLGTLGAVAMTKLLAVRRTRDADRYGDVAGAAGGLRAVAEGLEPLSLVSGTVEERTERYAEVDARLGAASAQLRRAASRYGPEISESAAKIIAATRDASILVSLWLGRGHGGHVGKSDAFQKAADAQRAALECIDAFLLQVDDDSPAPGRG